MNALRTKRGNTAVSTCRSSAMRWGLLVLAIALGLSSCADPKETFSADGPLPVVDEWITAEELPLRDEYWPHKVRLTQDWAPESGARLRPIGVLLRVESAEHARVDFGRDGIHEVPIAVTDLLERANELRGQGAHAKIGNLTRMIGGALGDPRFDPWRSYKRSQIARRDLLLVAAPLDASLLREMAAPLARIDEREGVRVVLLIQGETTSEGIFRVLHEIGWTTPFLLERFVRATTEGTLGEDLALPWLALLTPNGRVLHQGPWPPDGALPEGLDVLAERRREREGLLAATP